jgi:dethiobiotin synthetase
VIEKDVVLKHIRSSVRLAEYSFVEGVGGFDIPLNSDWTTADLAADLQFPVILVVGMRLGCINHALLSIESIERRGLQLAGWVGNFVDPNFSFAKENLSTLSDRIKSPIIGTVPYMEEPLQDVDVSDFQLKQLLDC